MRRRKKEPLFCLKGAKMNEDSVVMVVKGDEESWRA